MTLFSNSAINTPNQWEEAKEEESTIQSDIFAVGYLGLVLATGGLEILQRQEQLIEEIIYEAMQGRAQGACCLLHLYDRVIAD